MDAVAWRAARHSRCVHCGLCCKMTPPSAPRPVIRPRVQHTAGKSELAMPGTKASSSWPACLDAEGRVVRIRAETRPMSPADLRCIGPRT